MRVKLFDNTTGLETGDFFVPPSDRDNFDVSSHDTETSTAIQSSEEVTEVLVNGDKYVLDLSNRPSFDVQTQYAQITGYEAKSGGGYQATWVVETIPTSEPAPEEPA